MNLTNVLIGLIILRGYDLNLVFADKDCIWLPCAKQFAFAGGIKKSHLQIMRQCGWDYHDNTESFLFRMP